MPKNFLHINANLWKRSLEINNYVHKGSTLQNKYSVQIQYIVMLESLM